MAEYARLYWTSSLGSGGLSRRDRRGGAYDVYLPDLLIGRTIALSGETAADVADAEAAIVRLDAQATTLAGTEVMSRLLLRAESVASSRIEGLEIGVRRLLRAEVVRSFDEKPADTSAVVVLANIAAMADGVAAIAPGRPITAELLLSLHRRLLERTAPTYAGLFRHEQNWIGGSSYNPCSAAYVPPPADRIDELMADLIDFCNTEDLPAVAQAAIAHAQFETIHPFVDGNGRVGRILIHLILRRRGVTTRVLPPVSLILATRAGDYIEGLIRFRYLGDSTSSMATEGLNIWVGRFAGACIRAVADAALFESTIADLERQWRTRVSPVRAGSATDLLLRVLPAAPVITVSTAATLIGRAYSATNDAITRLVDANILRQITVGRRNRAFESPAALAAFTALERRLASPDGDTAVSPPNRPVPHRT